MSVDELDRWVLEGETEAYGGGIPYDVRRIAHRTVAEALAFFEQDRGGPVPEAVAVAFVQATWTPVVEAILEALKIERTQYQSVVRQDDRGWFTGFGDK